MDGDIEIIENTTTFNNITESDSSYIENFEINNLN